ncbi:MULTISPECIES: universal stress protein [Serratia]|jgi:universal stress protein G|uniref:Universal stress protein n=1 Tax=Serratia fonticola TaxID=47917 RepID=A0A0F7HEA2_SERFO|nr:MULTISPECIES: universal stress protein [Serratia]ERK16955.1 Universal stress protein G [Serratia fonticola AU-P3(3)]AKG71031.1 universal stress protein [Serratia fonticola]ALX94633.1 universal stress protein [Serratia fonticola]AYM89931.1 universal stress protein [Serratia sp. 3ACOL1]MBC3216416.1 universal stress protein [Serratia fonticola]
MYKTILVPVDLAEDVLTEHALEHVEYLAKMSGAKVHFFHALPDASAFVTAYSFGIKEFENQAEVKAVEGLKKLMAGIDLPLERLSYTISFGSPRDEVLQLAEEISADLIVIGSRRPSVKTYLLGSNAAAIVRHAKISVMVVR